MGTLVEQNINSLYNGVSRQPPSVRLPGQAEDSKNTILSVITGGVSKRAGTDHITEIADITSSEDIFVYSYERDDNEKYIVLIGDGWIRVFDLDGTEYTVNSPDGTDYLIAATPSSFFSAITVGDFTVIANKDVKVYMDELPLTDIAKGTGTNIGNMTDLANAWDSDDGTVATGTGGSVTVGKDFSSDTRVDGYVLTPGSSGLVTGGTVTGKVSVIIEGSHDNTTWFDLDTVLVDADITADITQGGAFEQREYRYWRIRITWSGTGTANVAELQFQEDNPSASITGYVSKEDNLPGTPADGTIYGVTSAATALDDYYVMYNSTKGVWEETVDPTVPNDFKLSTMPHQLVREADGTFTFETADWKSREVGDLTVTPNPDFVGDVINALVFHRNRIGIIANETVYFGQAGDYFNMWPDEATQVLDSDPFGLTASSPSVNVIRQAVPFRKALFAVSDRAQFEVSGDDILSPKTAAIDLATEYDTEGRCRPVTLGSELYFAARSGAEAALFEYSYDDTTLSNVAAEVSLHARGYVPSPLVQMASDTVTAHVFMLSDGDRGSIYGYRVYWDGDTKAQSAWNRWDFSEHDASSTYIHGIRFVNGRLYLVIRRDGTTYLESVSNGIDPVENTLDFMVCLDRRVELTGTYDAGTNLTTWTIPYPHNDDIVAVTSSDFAEGEQGRVLTLEYPTSTTVTTSGDLSAYPVIFGTTYTMDHELSPLYMRDGQDRIILAGRLQVRSIAVNYRNTGYFEVRVTPDQRDTKISKFTGRILGSSLNKIGSTPILENGVFRARVNGRGEKTQIKIVNDTHIPCQITSAYWIGYFNEITRQDSG